MTLLHMHHMITSQFYISFQRITKCCSTYLLPKHGFTCPSRNIQNMQMICRWFLFSWFFRVFFHHSLGFSAPPSCSSRPVSPFRVMGPAERGCDPIGVDGLDFAVSVSKGYTEYAVNMQNIEIVYTNCNQFYVCVDTEHRKHLKILGSTMIRIDQMLARGYVQAGKSAVLH